MYSVPFKAIVSFILLFLESNSVTWRSLVKVNRWWFAEQYWVIMLNVSAGNRTPGPFVEGKARNHSFTWDTGECKRMLCFRLNHLEKISIANVNLRKMGREKECAQEWERRTKGYVIIRSGEYKNVQFKNQNSLRGFCFLPRTYDSWLITPNSHC